MQKEMDFIMGMIEAGGGRVAAADVVRAIEVDPDLRRNNYAVSKHCVLLASCTLTMRVLMTVHAFTNW